MDFLREIRELSKERKLVNVILFFWRPAPAAFLGCKGFISIHFGWEFVYPTLSTTPERFPIVSRPKNVKNVIFSKNVIFWIFGPWRASCRSRKKKENYFCFFVFVAFYIFFIFICYFDFYFFLVFYFCLFFFILVIIVYYFLFCFVFLLLF